MKVLAPLLIGALCMPAEGLKGSQRIKHLIEKVIKSGDDVSTSVVAGLFDVAGFEAASNYGKVGVKLRINSPEKIKLTKEQQHSKWTPISEENSPLATGMWKPTKDGFRFKSTDNEEISCAAAGGTPKAESLLVHFDCRFRDPKDEYQPRFAQVSHTFWQACPDDHVPYGWPSDWGDFDYSFYAVTQDGFLGCKYLTKDGYCVEDEATPGAALYAPFGYNDSPDTPVAKFPFDSYKEEDLMPDSHYYTSATPAPEESHADSTPGVTTSLQPAEKEEAAEATPATDSTPAAKDGDADADAAPAAKPESKSAPEGGEETPKAKEPAAAKPEAAAADTDKEAAADASASKPDASAPEAKEDDGGDDAKPAAAKSDGDRDTYSPLAEDEDKGGELPSHKKVLDENDDGDEHVKPDENALPSPASKSFDRISKYSSLMDEDDEENSNRYGSRFGEDED